MNPFLYPKNKHRRSETPPQYSRYQSYKPHLRTEFARRCVYCQLPDTAVPDTSIFGVDHYRPKSLFPRLATHYPNLYYCCNVCNRRKGDYWPKEARSPEFIPNPCDHEMYKHLRYEGETVLAKTDAGKLAVRLLDLNAPDALRFRRQVLTACDALKEREIEQEKLIAQLRQKLAKKLIPDALIAEAERSLLHLESQLKAIRDALADLAPEPRLA